jgi:hypothetical protein
MLSRQRTDEEEEDREVLMGQELSSLMAGGSTLDKHRAGAARCCGAVGVYTMGAVNRGVKRRPLEVNKLHYLQAHREAAGSIVSLSL